MYELYPEKKLWIDGNFSPICILLSINKVMDVELAGSTFNDNIFAQFSHLLKADMYVLIVLSSRMKTV